jgi:hypothetical protein
VRQWGKHRTAGRWRRSVAHAECFPPFSARRAVLPARSALAFLAGGWKVWKELPPALLCEAQSPLWGEWPWSWFRSRCTPQLLVHSSSPPPDKEHQRYSGTNAKDRRSATRSVRRVRNERSGSTSCPKDLAPLFALVTGPFLPVPDRQVYRRQLMCEAAPGVPA